MNINILYGSKNNEIYKITNRYIIIKNNYGIWEEWKERISNGWNKVGEVKVTKKKYKEIQRNRLKGVSLIEYSLSSRNIYVELIRKQDYQKIKLKYELLEEEQVRKLSFDNIKSLSQKIQNHLKFMEPSLIPDDDYERYVLLFQEFQDKLDNKDFKDIEVTKQLNKERKLLEYKSQIDTYLSQGNYTSISKLCKDLNISRRTFYAYDLNSYLTDNLTSKGVE